MDQKSWPWKKKSTEIITMRPDKVNNSFNRNEEVDEVREHLDEKAELERSLRLSNEKLSAAVADCNAKDIITKKQVKIAQEAIAGWEKADGEAMSLKKELDKVILQKAASEQRLGQLDAALKECMQQLRFVRDEQEKRIHSAVLKTSEDFEKTKIAFDEKLSDADSRLAKLEADNTQLRKDLSGKEKVIKELSQYRADVEADFNSLMSRVESTDKENTSLKYEVRVLEKELDIRNEEREYLRRTADVATRKQQESVKKIANLEAECQKLRLLVRKRLPGPAALAKMKNEASMLGNNYFPSRRKTNLSSINSEHDARINFLIEHLQKLEEENRSLKMLHLSKFSRIETIAEQGKYPGHLLEKNVAASSDMGSDDKASCVESWASPSYKNVGTSEMSLMDDFAEMEKLAVVSVDYPAGSSNHSSEEGPSREQSEPLIRSRGEVVFDDILKMLVEYCQESQRKPVEVLNDIKVSLSQNKLLNFETSDNGNHYNISSKIDGRKLESSVSESIHKILELLEGINMTNEDNGLSYKNSEPPTGYMIRAFQWKSDEICSLLQRFVQNCNDLLSGTANVEHFVQEVARNLDWVMNHCFSVQDVSSMKDAIRNHLDWDDSRSDSEVDCGSVNHSIESNNKLLSPLGGCNSSSRIEAFQHNDAKEEDRSVHMIENSQSEKIVMMHSEEKTGDIVGKEKTVKEVEFQQTDTHIEQRKLCEKISQLENELENRNECCQKLEETCIDLKLELESMTSKGADVNGEQWEKQRRNDQEITAASEKIAECQETILNLGKKLKAMATPKEAALSDKVISSPAYTDPTSTSTPHRDLSRRSSLLDKMLSEDNDKIGSSRNKDDTQNGNCFSTASSNAAIDDRDETKTPAASTAIEPYKKSGGRSLFKKLFTRAKKGKCKKTSLL